MAGVWNSILHGQFPAEDHYVTRLEEKGPSGDTDLATYQRKTLLNGSRGRHRLVLIV
jgi:hypothetical protein